MGLGQSILGSFVNTMDPNNSNPSSVTARLIMAGVAPSDAIVKGAHVSAQMRQAEMQQAQMAMQQQQMQQAMLMQQRQQQVGQGLMSLLQNPNVTDKDIAHFYVQNGMADQIPNELLKTYENDIKDVENLKTGEYYRYKNGINLGLAPISGGGNYGANGGAGGTSGNAAFTDTVQNNAAPPDVMNRGLGNNYPEGSGFPEGKAVQAGVEPIPSNLPKKSLSNQPNYRMTPADIIEEKKKERETRGLRAYAEFIQKNPNAGKAEKLITLLENGIENPERFLETEADKKLLEENQKVLTDLQEEANDATAMEADLKELERSLQNQKETAGYWTQPGALLTRNVGKEGWISGIADTIARVIDKEGVEAIETANKTQELVANRMISRNKNAASIPAQEAIRKTIPNVKQFTGTQESAFESKRRFNYQRILNNDVVNKLVKKGYPARDAMRMFNDLVGDVELMVNKKPNPEAKKYFDKFVEELPSYEEFSKPR